MLSGAEKINRVQGLFNWDVGINDESFLFSYRIVSFTKQEIDLRSERYPEVLLGEEQKINN